MEVGFFTMPIHPLDKDYRKTLAEDREAFLFADEIGFLKHIVENIIQMLLKTLHQAQYS